MADARRTEPRLWRRDAAADDAPDFSVSWRIETAPAPADERPARCGPRLARGLRRRFPRRYVLGSSPAFRAPCPDLCDVQGGERSRHSKDRRLSRNLVRG